MTFKALGIGLPKTGTTTVCSALRQAGINALHKRRPDQQPAGYHMLRAFRHGYKLGTFLPSGVEAVTQLDHMWNKSPQSCFPQEVRGFLRAFTAQYPEARIILHTRDPKLTLRSIKAWGNLRDRIPRSVPSLPDSCTDKELLHWIEQYYVRMRRLFKRHSHFVEFDIADPRAPDILASAFGIEFPWWGVRNPNASIGRSKHKCQGRKKTGTK